MTRECLRRFVDSIASCKCDLRSFGCVYTFHVFTVHSHIIICILLEMACFSFVCQQIALFKIQRGSGHSIKQTNKKIIRKLINICMRNESQMIFKSQKTKWMSRRRKCYENDAVAETGQIQLDIRSWHMNHEAPSKQAFSNWLDVLGTRFTSIVDFKFHVPNSK